MVQCEYHDILCLYGCIFSFVNIRVHSSDVLQKEEFWLNNVLRGINNAISLSEKWGILRMSMIFIT